MGCHENHMNADPAKESKKLVFWKRTVSTLGLWGVVAAGFASRVDWVYLILLGGVMLLASREYFQMLKQSRVAGFPRFGFLAAAVFAGLSGWLLWDRGEVPAGWDGAWVVVALIGAFCLQLRHEIAGRRALEAVAFTLVGFVGIALMFGYASRIVFEVPGASEVPGAMVLLWMVAVTKFTDMGAYLVGSAVGRHKMIPHVSPAKTWEGFAGALVFAQLAGCGLYVLFREDMPEFASGLQVLGGWVDVVGLGLVLSLLAVVGDLAESVIKRSLDVKDSGHVLPGIGGALDLIDSLCFTAPVMYFYLIWMV